MFSLTTLSTACKLRHNVTSLYIAFDHAGYSRPTSSILSCLKNRFRAIMLAAMLNELLE
jgi:RNA:NAD 2'-phosphotransferase (TPT1/KptA family)